MKPSKAQKEHREMLRRLQKQLNAELEPVWRRIVWNAYFELEKQHPEWKQKRLEYAATHPEWAAKRSEYAFR